MEACRCSCPPPHAAHAAEAVSVETHAVIAARWRAPPSPRACSCPVIRDSRTVRSTPSSYFPSRTSSTTTSPLSSSSPSWTWRRHGLVLLAVLVACTLPTMSSSHSSTATSPGGGGAGGSGTSTPIVTAVMSSSSSSEDYHHHNHQHQHHHRHHNGSRTSSSSSPSRGKHHDEDDVVAPGRGGGGCSSCRMREELRSLSLESIKQQILHKLNLQQAPNITGRRLPINYEDITELLDAQPMGGGGQHLRHGHMDNMQGDDPGAGGNTFRPGPEVFEEEDDYHAKMERIIAFPQIHSNKVRHRYRGQSVLHFRFSQKVMQNQVAKAVLWLWVRGTGTSPRPDQNKEGDAEDVEEGGVRRDENDEDDEDEDDLEPAWRQTVHIGVTRMRRGDAPSGPLPFEAEATAKLRRPDGDGVWVTVDVKKVVDDWFRRPRDNLGLTVHSTEGEDRKQLVTTDTNEDENPKIPFIEVYLTDGRKRRVRRNVGLNCKENSTETRCCRYPLTVDFEKFGWDFIIAPKRYEANYCAGECPYVYQQKYPHTAIMHLVNKDGPCCAPRKMSPINMLYFDSEYNVVYGVLPGMVVDRCGCA